MKIRHFSRLNTLLDCTDFLREDCDSCKEIYLKKCRRNVDVKATGLLSVSDFDDTNLWKYL